MNSCGCGFRLRTWQRRIEEGLSRVDGECADFIRSSMLEARRQRLGQHRLGYCCDSAPAWDAMVYQWRNVFLQLQGASRAFWDAGDDERAVAYAGALHALTEAARSRYMERWGHIARSLDDPAESDDDWLARIEADYELDEEVAEWLA